MAEKNETGQANTRWWESYLVRYFLGFIVGAICVSIIAVATDVIPQSSGLFSNTTAAVEHESKYGITAIVIAVSLLGLAYCYLASSPITVMRAGRYGSGSVDRLSRYFWLGWVLALGLTLGAKNWLTYLDTLPEHIYWLAIAAFGCWVVISGIYLSKDRLPATSTAGTHDQLEVTLAKSFSITKLVNAVPFCALVILLPVSIFKSFSVPLEIGTLRMLIFGMPVIWIGFAQYFVLFRILKEPGRNYYFYRQLFAARRQRGAQDVRDTYTHLREHSNAVFIVAVELSVLSLVLGLLHFMPIHETNPSSPMEGGSFLLAAIGIWIVPTIFMWSRANAMERFFAEQPDVFLGTEGASSAGADSNAARGLTTAVDATTVPEKGNGFPTIGFTVLATAVLLWGLRGAAKPQTPSPTRPS